MDRYGDMFPEHPRTLDELLEVLARRMTAMSRLLASLSPEQRRELEELAQALLSDMDLAFQMDQLAGELRALAPHLPWDQPMGPMGGFGEGPMPLPAAVGAAEGHRRPQPSQAFPYRESAGGVPARGRPRPAGFGRAGERIRVALQPDDFELVESETRTRTATALLLDLSFSMPLRGHWLPAKRMALALHALIEGKFPQDRLYLIGFSDYARRLQPTDLTATAPLERVYGTNMQHAFLLARRLLAEEPRASKQVIMVTDGEPTAHLVDIGPERAPEAFFSWPPTSETRRRR